MQAYQFRPSRLESVFYLARFYREQKQPHLALLFARLWKETPYPDDFLFIERAAYEIGLPMEYALACTMVGRHEDALPVYRSILQRTDVHPFYVEAARNNLEAALPEQIACSEPHLSNSPAVLTSGSFPTGFISSLA